MIVNALKIDGWMFRDELKWLAQVASKSSLIVEFGCYKGRSTRALADNTQGTVIAVDPWEEFYPDKNGNKHGINPSVYPEFYVNLKDHIDSGKVIPVKQYSTKFNFDFGEISPDFIFIDGDHRYEAVLKDIELGKKLIKKGILAGHDYGHYDWPGVKQAVDEVFLGKFGRINSIWWVNLEN